MQVLRVVVELFCISNKILGCDIIIINLQIRGEIHVENRNVRSADATKHKSNKKYGVFRIGIFGSFSKGDATQYSDVDILIAFEPDKKNFDNYIELKFFLEELIGRDVDLVIEENIKKELREEILRSVHYVKAA